MKKRIIKIIGVLIFVCFIAIIIRLFVGEPCSVPSASMEPTILTGDWLWINKAAYGCRLPRRWADIPLVNAFTHIPALRRADEKNDWGYNRMSGFQSPEIGDIIVFNNPEDEGSLLVKRIVCIVRDLNTNSTNTDSVSKQNYYYVLGDNREISRDSRFFGNIPERLIIGKMSRGIFSIEKSEGGKSNLRLGRFFFQLK